MWVQAAPACLARQLTVCSSPPTFRGATLLTGEHGSMPKQQERYRGAVAAWRKMTGATDREPSQELSEVSRDTAGYHQVTLRDEDGRPFARLALIGEEWVSRGGVARVTPPTE